MDKLNFENIFFDALDTFKVFEDLKLDYANKTIADTPKTVWQILNHLIIWQQYQLNILNQQINLKHIDETETWQVSNAHEQDEIDAAIVTFNNQIKRIKAIISSLSVDMPDIQSKLKYLQDITSHLSFHLGEIILIRRQMKNYPQPHEMKHFLAK